MLKVGRVKYVTGRKSWSYVNWWIRNTNTGMNLFLKMNLVHLMPRNILL
jgi:hypothetical protein